VLEEALGVRHFDADPLILDLVARGIVPHPVDGWSPWVQPEVERLLADNGLASVEAVGAYEADFDIADRMETRGHRVIRVWLTAPVEETLSRLRSRTVPRAPTTEEAARESYRKATEIAARRRWDLVFDASGAPDPDRLLAALGPLLTNDMTQ
jgi:hypothetical protein